MVADLRTTFNYSYNEIMYEIPFSNLVMQLKSHYKAIEDSYKNVGEHNDKLKKQYKSIADL